MVLSIIKHFAFRLIPKDPFSRTLLLHCALAMVFWAMFSAIARKYLNHHPYIVLCGMALASFGLGIWQVARLRKYSWEANTPLKTSSPMLASTLLAGIVLYVAFRATPYTSDIIVLPLIGLSTFFVERALHEWVNMPDYVPPYTTLEHYTKLMGLRVFDKSTNFIRFVLHTSPHDQPDPELPSNIGWSVEKERALTLPLKDLFAVFLLYNNYNERGAMQIRVAELGEQSEPYRWAFYTTKCFFWRSYLLPERSLHTNQITLWPSWWVIDGRVQFIRKKTIYVTRFKSNTL